MTRCDEMREGDVYVCETCGLRVEIIEECSHDDADEAEESCHVEEFRCCGEPLTLQED